MSDWSDDDIPVRKAPIKIKKPVYDDDSWSDDEPVKRPPIKKPEVKKPEVKKPEVKKPEIPKAVKNPVPKDFSDEEPKIKKKETRVAKPPPPPSDDWSDSDCDQPKMKIEKQRLKPIPEKPKKVKNDDWSDEEVECRKVKKVQVTPVVEKRRVKPKQEEWSDEEQEIKPKTSKIKKLSEPIQKPTSKPTKPSEWSDEEPIKPKKITKPAKPSEWSDDEPVKPKKTTKVKIQNDWSDDDQPAPPPPKTPSRLKPPPKQKSEWSDEEPEIKPKKISKPLQIEQPPKPTTKVKKHVEWSDEEPKVEPKRPVKQIQKSKPSEWSDDEKPTKPIKIKEKEIPQKVKPIQKQKSEWSDDETEIKPEIKPKKTKVVNSDFSDDDDSKVPPKSSKSFKNDDDDDNISVTSKTEEKERTPVTYEPTYFADEDADIYAKTCVPGIDFNKYHHVQTSVTGNNKFRYRAKTWSDMKLSEPISEIISEWLKWETPTPVQQYCIPSLTNQIDIIAAAQTGSGKTGAYAIPIIQSLLNTPELLQDSDSEDKVCCKPLALIIAPTRELVQQIQRDFIKLCKHQNIKCEYVVGGHSVRFQLNRIEDSHIIVATPGRLNDFVGKNKIDLSRIKYLVIDEADRMLEMGFYNILNGLALKMPDKEHRVTAMFSATFPDEIQKIATEFLKDDFLFVAIGRVGGAASTVKQTFLECSPDFDKEEALVNLVKHANKKDKIVIFVQTRRQADYFAIKLSSLELPATSIHGDRDQQQREEAIQTFLNGEYPILIATNVAARGLDIPNVTHVVNFELPKEIEEYVHRIGRTGRCGHNGKSTSFYNPKRDQEKASQLKEILESSMQAIPEFLIRDCGEQVGISVVENANVAVSDDDEW